MEGRWIKFLNAVLPSSFIFSVYISVMILECCYTTLEIKFTFYSGIINNLFYPKIRSKLSNILRQTQIQWWIRRVENIHIFPYFGNTAITTTSPIALLPTFRRLAVMLSSKYCLFFSRLPTLDWCACTSSGVALLSRQSDVVLD